MNDPLDIDYDSPDDDHAVMITVRLERGGFGDSAERRHMEHFEVGLAKLVEQAEVGILDGNEIGNGEYTLFFYGPDADALWAVIEDSVTADPITRGARIVLRYGDADDARARTIRI